MNFVTGLLLSADQKSDSYNLILVIINRFTKMVHYKPLKVTINAPKLVKAIIDVVNFIINDQRAIFTSKFWFLPCYFLNIKRRLSTAFHPQIYSQTKRQNSMIEAYLRAFVNFEQNDWAKFLLIAEFAYNNAKNVSTSHIFFEWNCSYHLGMSYKKTLIFVSGQKRLGNYRVSFNISYQFAVRTSIMPKNFKSKPTIET